MRLILIGLVALGLSSGWHAVGERRASVGSVLALALVLGVILGVGLGVLDLGSGEG